ncbi:MAG: sigma-70 family RNA polymerase sigma factor [Phycisphaerae bacterium]
MNPSSPHPQATDAELVSRAQRGDRAAAAALVLRYQDRVYNTCYRMCHHHADSLDLAQGALLRALQALPNFESRSNFFTWLFRIVVNHVLTHRRRKRPESPLRLSDDDTHGHEPTSMEDDDPSVSTQREELHERLHDAISRLEDEFRTVVVLKDIEGMDYAQISEVLDIPIGTVKSRIHRGRMMLRAMLQAVGELPDGRQ